MINEYFSPILWVSTFLIVFFDKEVFNMDRAQFIFFFFFGGAFFFKFVL